MTSSLTRPRLDPAGAAALELARAAALEVGEGAVGEHFATLADGERIVTHLFAATLTGYVGWHWAVTVARASRSTAVTIDEVALLPGAEALLAPDWVPWSERLRSGDLSPGDLLEPAPDDVRLVPAYAEADQEELGVELGLGRERVMSRDGRLDAADRWYLGETGPDTPMARQASGPCGTCGFMVSMAGVLRAGFGVCGNEFGAADGRVVSVEYGCGAHSQTVVIAPSLAEPTGAIYDDGDVLEVSDSGGPALGAVPAQQDETGEAEQPAGQAGPEPEPMTVMAEAAPEGQQDQEAQEE